MHLTLGIGPFNLYVHLGWNTEDQDDEDAEDEAVVFSDSDLDSELADQGDHHNAEIQRNAGFEAR